MAAKTFILKFGRCGWSRCLFCGYGSLRGRTGYENIRKEMDWFFSTLQAGDDSIKVFGSGSFLDDKQIPPEARAYFIEKCIRKGIRKLTIESRPEFITPEKLKEFSGLDLEVSIGLEVADDRILDKINKGFHLRDYEKAAKILKENGVALRTYLLVNPPYVKDTAKSLDDSVKYALKFSDSIVLINLLPHHTSKLMAMWLRGEWNFLSREEFHKVVEKWSNNPKIEVDEETFRFIPKFQPSMRENLTGVGERYLTHPHFEVWQDYLVRWYQKPKEKRMVLFLPCSYKKPYSESKTHKKIIATLSELNAREIVHEVMLSNAGVVPREFENLYPFNSYDWDEGLETEEIKKRYIEVTAERIRKYLQTHRYEKILCFLKYDSESYKALEKACSELMLGFNNLLKKETYEKIKGEKHPLQRDEALSDLCEGINNEINEIQH